MGCYSVGDKGNLNHSGKGMRRIYVMVPETYGSMYARCTGCAMQERNVEEDNRY